MLFIYIYIYIYNIFNEFFQIEKQLLKAFDYMPVVLVLILSEYLLKFYMKS